MKSTCFFLVILLAGAGCFSPKTYFQKGNYDKSVRLYAAQARSGQLNSDGKTGKMQLAFSLAQTKDLLALADLENSASPEKWVEINEIWKRVAERQATVARSFSKNKDAAENFAFIENADSLELASRERAADFFYEKGLAYLENGKLGDRMAARAAWSSFFEIEKRYFKNWKDVAEQKFLAKKFGTTHILLKLENRWIYNFEFADLPLENDLNTEWTKFHDAPGGDFDIHFEAVCVPGTIFPGFENVSRNCWTESKDIEKSVVEVRDSTGKVIERKVTYEKVSAEICQFTTTKTGYANFEIQILDAKTGENVRQNYFQETRTDCSTCTSVSGDSRATSATSTCYFPPSACSDFWMVLQLKNQLKSRVEWELRGLVAGI